MLSPLPYCDAVSRRVDTKTIKLIINEAFVASIGDIITDYNDLYCLFTCHVESRRVISYVYVNSFLCETFCAAILARTPWKKRFYISMGLSW